MTHITYDFEELTPYKGLSVLVYGSAEIVGEWDDADPDVGIMSGGWDYGIESISINSYETGEPVIISTDHPLYKLIETELYSHRFADHIREQLGDSDERDPDYFRD
jgi:hypothetical protein